MDGNVLFGKEDFLSKARNLDNDYAGFITEYDNEYYEKLISEDQTIFPFLEEDYYEDNRIDSTGEDLTNFQSRKELKNPRHYVMNVNTHTNLIETIKSGQINGHTYKNSLLEDQIELPNVDRLSRFSKHKSNHFLYQNYYFQV